MHMHIANKKLAEQIPCEENLIIYQFAIFFKFH